MKKNAKVPIAVLSCFLIAFVVQGALKIKGIFIFEKSLDWGIFKVIDSTKWLEVTYYTLVMVATMYCLSFVLTNRWYSKRWYHYVIIAVASTGITLIRVLIPALSTANDIMLDILAYIIIPLAITITTDKNDRIFNNNVFGVVITLALHIMFYFAYIGINFWSSLISSLLIIDPVYLNSSAHFLIELEVYIGLISLMLSGNMLVSYIKEINNMIRPTNIASEEAKINAKIKHLEKKDAKAISKHQVYALEIDELNKRLAEIKAQQN